MTPYPLQWPMGCPRNPRPKPTTTQHTLAAARTLLLKELSLFKTRQVVISSNAAIGKTGTILAKQPRILDAGVAVFFVYNNVNFALACDEWDSLRGNLVGLLTMVKGFRSILKYNGQYMLARAMYPFYVEPGASSYQQQSGSYSPPPPPPPRSPPPPPPPPPKNSKEPRTWREVFGLVGKVATWSEVYSRYRKMAKELHPDKPTGSTVKFQELNNAYEQAKKHFGFKE